MVYGCGGVGLALVQVLRLAGVRPIAVSRTPAKLERATELGAEVVVNASEEEVASRVKEATDGRGVEAVFELVGNGESMGQSLRSLGRSGALVFIGYSFDRLQLSPLELVVPEAKRPEAAAQDDCLVWVGHGDQAPDGRTMAFLRGSLRSEAPFQLVVADLDTGGEIAVVPLAGARYDTVTRIEWDGRVAVVSFTDRSPVLVSTDGTVTSLDISGTVVMAP